MKKSLKYLIIIVFGLLLFAVVGKKTGIVGGEKPIKVAVEKVARRTIYESITANGVIDPEKEIKISADVSGEIVDIYVKEGEEVKKNQLLLKIKPNIYISGRNRALAAVNSAKANYENAKARLEQTEAQFQKIQMNYERNKKLWEQGTISQAEWEGFQAEYEMGKADVNAAKQNVKSAEFSVKSAEASLDEAEENLTKTSVFAAMDGIITKLNVEKGERVVGTEMMAGTELLRIADLNRMEVKVDVNENDIIRVKVGDTAVVEVDAYIDEKFYGIVTDIAHSATTTGQVTDKVTSFEVKIIMLSESYKGLITDKNKYPFRPGMTANVEIRTNMKKDVISVPLEAITSRTDSIGNKKDTLKDKDNVPIDVVFVREGNVAIMKKIKMGIQDSNYAEILEGVNLNDEVIVAPFFAVSKKLKDGQLIKVVSKEEIFKE